MDPKPIKIGDCIFDIHFGMVEPHIDLSSQTWLFYYGTKMPIMATKNTYYGTSNSNADLVGIKTIEKKYC
jgi:hypothetical protein